jgi:ribose-phosphate pyrophosphokinase
MKIRLLSGSANRPLAEAISRSVNAPLIDATIERFPDGELEIVIAESIRDGDVYFIQPTCAPVGEALIELLLLGDACRRAGAARVTAVMPYFGYARQDRRTSGREPVSARLVADLLQTGGFHRIVAVDLHCAVLEGIFAIPLKHLSAVPLLAEAARGALNPQSIVVAPDLGAVKLVERFGALLRLPLAIVHKTRLSGTEVHAGGKAHDDGEGAFHQGGTGPERDEPDDRDHTCQYGACEGAHQRVGCGRTFDRARPFWDPGSPQGSRSAPGLRPDAERSHHPGLAMARVCAHDDVAPRGQRRHEPLGLPRVDGSDAGDRLPILVFDDEVVLDGAHVPYYERQLARCGREVPGIVLELRGGDGDLSRARRSGRGAARSAASQYCGEQDRQQQSATA